MLERRVKKEKAMNHPPAITLIDFESSNIEYHLSQSTHILISVPPAEGIGDLVLSYYAALIKRHAVHIEWIGYLSSTGVYGDHQGNWVNEESICTPKSSSGTMRLEAEKSWLSYAKSKQLPLHLFRLAGIYGSERNPLERIQSGKNSVFLKKGRYFHVSMLMILCLCCLPQ